MRSLGVVVALCAIATAGLAATYQSRWIGTYKTKQMQLVSSAKSDNYLTVTRMSGGGYRFTFEAVSAGCIGEADFRTAKLATGNDMMLSTDDGNGGVCIMRVHRDPDATIIAAEDGCEQLRGMECTFSGTYRPESRK